MQRNLVLQIMRFYYGLSVAKNVAIKKILRNVRDIKNQKLISLGRAPFACMQRLCPWVRVRFKLYSTAKLALGRKHQIRCNEITSRLVWLIRSPATRRNLLNLSVSRFLETGSRTVLKNTSQYRTRRFLFLVFSWLFISVNLCTRCRRRKHERDECNKFICYM